MLLNLTTRFWLQFSSKFKALYLCWRRDTSLWAGLFVSGWGCHIKCLLEAKGILLTLKFCIIIFLWSKYWVISIVGINQDLWKMEDIWMDPLRVYGWLNHEGKGRTIAVLNNLVSKLHSTSDFRNWEMIGRWILSSSWKTVTLNSKDLA